MTGVHLKVSAYYEPPIFTFVKDVHNSSIIQYAGLYKDIMDWLSTSLNFTYSFVEVPANAVKTHGSLDSTLIDYLIRKEVDMISRLMTPRVDLLNVMDFTTPVTVTQFAFTQPFPKLEEDILASVKPFQTMVWLSIGISFIAVVLAMTFVIRNGSIDHYKNKTTAGIILELALYGLVILLGQGGRLPCNRLSLRLIAGSWCLMAVVLSYGFSGTLISNITAPKYEPVINTYEDMANSKTMRITVASGSPFAENMLNGTSGVMGKLGDSLRQNPGDLILRLPRQIGDNLLTGCCAYLESKTIGDIIVRTVMMKSGGQCLLTTGKPVDYSELLSFGITKNFRYRSIIDQQLQLMRESGLFSFFRKKYVVEADKCNAHRVLQPKKKPLTLFDFASAFFVLGIGGILSLLVFFSEWISIICLHRRRPLGRGQHPVLFLMN
ncbi:glutamate receptor ionotropic, delta-1 isoform X2 [Daphnia magna]|nr:glutamate receptor ionotropic, delta-1 isoform X2 [Daphnia magna]